jgi:transcription elongation factor Elf1
MTRFTIGRLSDDLTVHYECPFCKTVLDHPAASVVKDSRLYATCIDCRKGFVVRVKA